MNKVSEWLSKEYLIWTIPVKARIVGLIIAIDTLVGLPFTLGKIPSVENEHEAYIMLGGQLSIIGLACKIMVVVFFVSFAKKLYKARYAGGAVASEEKSS